MMSRSALTIGCIVLLAVLGGVTWYFWPAESAAQATSEMPRMPWVKSQSPEARHYAELTNETLRSLAADTNVGPEDRVQAMYYLAQARDWNSVDTLIHQLQDPVPLVRGRAAAALRHILGTDFYFRAADPESSRTAAIDGIRRYWESRKSSPPDSE